VESQRYLLIVRRFLPLIVLITIAAGGSSAVFSLYQTTIYRATATLLINPSTPSAAIPFLSQSATTDPRAETQQLADTYSVYLKTTTFDASIVHALGLALSPSMLGSVLSSSLVGDTNFYTISATASTAREAALIANAVATRFITQSLTPRHTPVGQAADLTLQLTATKNELDGVRRLDQLLASKPALTGEDQQTLASLEARINYLTDIYTTLAAEAATGATQRLPPATVAEAASVPAQPLAPRRRSAVLIGSAAGLAIGIFLAFLLDYLTAALLTSADVERATGITPLAVIGATGAQPRHNIFGRRATRPEPALSGSPFPFLPGRLVRPRYGPLFALSSPGDPVTEAFRTLRTKLLFSNPGPSPRTLVVTSMLPAEGKTLVASNLAILFAQAGMRVILVDADLRRPALHTIFHLAACPGVSDLLLGSATLDAALQQTTVPNLRLLPCGSRAANPSELLSFPTLAPLVQELAASADLVIFDTPAMGGLTDALVVSARVEGTLMVIRAGTTSPQLLARGIESLRAVGARPLGTVLTMVAPSSLEAHGYFSHHHPVSAR
jgi:capsular exopolysaccharide synthesis family protein